MIDFVPLQVQTLYQELTDAHLSQAIRSEGPLGAPYLRQLRNKNYWYATQRKEGKIVQHYLGPDTDETRCRIDILKVQRATADGFDTMTSAMVAQLRAARLPTIDTKSATILSALISKNVFNLGCTLIGTHAFRLYEAELGRKITQAASAQTDDLDIASFEQLSVALKSQDSEIRDHDLAFTLASLGLELMPTTDKKGHSGRWRRRGGGAVLDFLAPSFSDDEKIIHLSALGIWAQSLHFLNYLIADPLPAVGLYRSGLLVRIPKPERYAIHKLIVAQRRVGTATGKRRKDLAQAAALIDVLAEDRPSELRDAYQQATSNGPAWRAAIGASLAMLPDKITNLLLR